MSNKAENTTETGGQAHSMVMPTPPTFDEWVSQEHPEWLEQGKQRGLAYVPEWMAAHGAWIAATARMEHVIGNVPLKNLKQSIIECYPPPWMA